MAVCAERRRSGKLNGRCRSPECSKDMNKPSAKANFICILLKRVLSSTKIAKAESNYENLFLKIAEPHPVFYKDSQNREKTKNYFIKYTNQTISKKPFYLYAFANVFYGYLLRIVDKYRNADK